MKIRGLGPLRRVSQRLRNKFVNKGLVLMYHRVAALPSDPHLLCVSPQHFTEQLEILAKAYVPTSLQQLRQALCNEQIIDRSVVVTFDDGYVDNLYNAKPQLERFEVPATVFVASSHIGKDRESWEDELERVLLQPGTLPPALSLTINGTVHHWELETATNYDETDFARYSHWNVETKEAPTSRHTLYRVLYQLLRSVTKEEREQAVEEIRTWARIHSPARSTHRFLSSEEVLRLAEGSCIEVGAHSVTHTPLCSLSITKQQAEIEESKISLEQILGRPVTSFAYPYGQYTPETMTIMQKAGFSLACSTVEEVVWRGSNCFCLPRVCVRNWDGEEFVRQLRKWFK